MSCKYLLDTSMISELMRNPQGRAARLVEQLDDDAVATSIIVAAELRFGAAKEKSARLKSEVEDYLAAMKVHSFEAPADVVYGDLRVALEAAGTPIGANALLIAAHALALHMVLVTDNEREFSRVPGLKVENWLR